MWLGLAFVGVFFVAFLGGMLLQIFLRPVDDATALPPTYGRHDVYSLWQRSTKRRDFYRRHEDHSTWAVVSVHEDGVEAWCVTCLVGITFRPQPGEMVQVTP
jgi:hypothetical protein